MTEYEHIAWGYTYFDFQRNVRTSLKQSRCKHLQHWH